MKKLLQALMLTFAFVVAQAQPNNVVISQVFGAGGNSGSPFTHDFVELFNPSDKTISIDGWTVHYAAATDDGGKWGKTEPLRGSIGPGQYFLIQLNSGSGNGNPLPLPDFTTVIANGLSAVDGKLALVSDTIKLTERCPSNNFIIDFVGYGKANCFETSAAPAGASNKGISRKNNGCTDTNDNASDFYAVAPSPRNSSSPVNRCNGASVKITSLSAPFFCITPSNGSAGIIAYEATGTFTNAIFNVLLSDAIGSFTGAKIIGTTTVNGTNPKGNIDVQVPEGLSSSNAYRIRVDVVSPSITGIPSAPVEIINGAVNVTALTASPNAEQMTLNWSNPQGCFEEIMFVVKEGASISAVPVGNAYTGDFNFSGNGSMLDGGRVVYKGKESGQVITGLQIGKEYFIKAFTRNGSFWSSGLEIKVKTRLLPQPGEILINQVSPQYDSASHEYIELVNTTGKTFDLSELSISYHAKTGNKAVAGNTLSGTLQPHSYWLLSAKENVVVGKTSLPRDGHCTDGFAATAGQIALLRKTDSTVIDGFGYGGIDVMTYTEKSPAIAPFTKGGYKRKTEGIDTDNNSADFERVANADIDLRNSSSRLAMKNAIINGGNYARIYVTGTSSISGDVNMSEKVVLQAGHLQLQDHHLATYKIEGGSSSSYLQANGNGTVTVHNINEQSTIIPIGNTTYNPVSITNGSGASWQVHIADEIKYTPTPFDNNKAILRTWMVKPLSAIANGATVQLQYGISEKQAGAEFNAHDVQVWNYNSQWLMVGELQKQTEINGAYNVTVKDWKNTGTFVIANAAAEMSRLAVLPIRFVNVNVKELPHAVQVEFTNSTESDVAAYIIERSTNGLDFTAIATINPIHNNGNAATYQWVDKTRPSGVIFYRVKGVEVDGKMMYSPVLKITIDKSIKALNVFPNPVKGAQLTWEASLPQGAYELRITTSNGQQVMHKTWKHSGGNTSQVVSLPAGTKSGVYLLQIINGHFIRQQTFVVL